MGIATNSSDQSGGFARLEKDYLLAKTARRPHRHPGATSDIDGPTDASHVSETRFAAQLTARIGARDHGLAIKSDPLKPNLALQEDGMPPEQTTIETADGACTAYLVAPEGPGPWPAVIFYMDGFGIRPAIMEMAANLASRGYVVLLPDLFYRFGVYGPLVPTEIMNGDARAVLGPLMGSTDTLKVAEDTRFYIEYLDGRPDVAKTKMGTVGFCMGGGMALVAAACYPDRIGAAASFHGGNLATDEPTSPHLMLDKLKAEVYVGIADNDHSFPPDMAERFAAALRDAGVQYKSEVYEGKSHGWMKPDMPVYDAEAAERGWKELFALYSRALTVG